MDSARGSAGDHKILAITDALLVADMLVITREVP